MLSILHSASLVGIDAQVVEVQVDLSRGLPTLNLVGLPDAAIREASQRVRSALLNSGLQYPLGRITVNLAPADLRKEGSGFDLPIALAIAIASGQLRPAYEGTMMAVGELSLDGRVCPVTGMLSIAEAARAAGISVLVIPEANRTEAEVIPGIPIVTVTSVTDAIRQLSLGRHHITSGIGTTCQADHRQWSDTACGSDEPPECDYRRAQRHIACDLKYVVGQAMARRCIEIAAAGGHSLLMVGPPGSGKSMLAQCLPGILPPLSLQEAIETTKIHSVAGLLRPGQSLITERPFRAPHHSTSRVGLIGGGSPTRPGELSLAHNGVLYLDELGEYRRDAIEALREPLETGKIVLNKHLRPVTYPCNAFVVASMNPCPCGFHGDPEHECTCSVRSIEAHLSVLRGPFGDRMDMRIEMQRVDAGQMAKVSVATSEPSEAVRERVSAARLIQANRFAGDPGILANARMTAADIRRFCRLGPDAEALLAEGVRRLSLTGRGVVRVLKVARTIADLDGATDIDVPHVAEALQFRQTLSEHSGCRDLLVNNHERNTRNVRSAG